MSNAKIFANVFIILCFTVLPHFFVQAATKDNSVTGHLSEIDAVVKKAMDEFKVSGVAVGIVVDGKVELSKGYGFRNRALKLPVTENTQFAIGSCTKAFTTFVLGQLVDEGLIEWDVPVITYIPEFCLMDQHATFNVTIRDLATHRTGLPRHDLLLLNSDLPRDSIIPRLKYLEPVCDLRAKFNYNNMTPV